MTEKVIYIADDGTEFNFENECQEYEWFKEIAPILDKIQMWDDEETPLAHPSTYQELSETLEVMHYVRGDVCSFFDAIYDGDLENNLLDYRSFQDEAQSADDNDLLMYDGDKDYWINVNKEFESLRDILKNFGVRG